MRRRVSTVDGAASVQSNRCRLAVEPATARSINAASGSAPRLVYAYGLPEEREFPLFSATATIGRETINEIVFDDAEISRRHVRVTHLAGRFIIEDLGSTNGTFLNGRRIEAPAPLSNGDVLDLGGSIRLTYLGPPGAAEATVVEPSVEQLGIPATAVRPSVAGIGVQT